MERNKRRSRPKLEALEGRALLNASRGHPAHAEATRPTTRLDYTTPQGAKVAIRLVGPGTLAGSAVAADGSLSLVFSGTSVFSAIKGTVQGAPKGAPGVAPLASIRDANVALDSLTGVGGELIGLVSLPQFDLVPGGNINLLGGVNKLTLDSVAANSQLHLRDTPLNTSLAISSSANAGQGYVTGNPTTSTTAGFGAGTSGAGINSVVNANLGLGAGSTTGVSSISNGSGNITGVGTLDPQVSGFGGTGVGATNGKLAIIPTAGNGQNNAGTPGLTQAQVSQGRVVSYIFEGNGGIQLTAVAGVFTPGSNLIEPRDISLPGFRPPPPGVILDIKHVNGGPAANTPPLGDPQVFGYDPAANALIRFDAANGARLQTIPLPASAVGQVGGVALARNGAERVALVGVGSEVLAYDANTGAAVGQFATSGPVSGLGTSERTTVVATSATLAGGTGVVRGIDVARSLATGQAVGVGTAFSPAREFSLGGGLTGLPGTNRFFALGAAHFDTAQPDRFQAGILTLAPAASGTLSESARAALPGPGGTVPANANGTLPGAPTSALGSIESSLALVTGVTNGRNVVAILNPSTFATQGTVTLNDANPLADLSESFHPELANTALVDVQGNVQSFTARTATGLVLNAAGNLDLLAIGRATDSSVVGLPFGHVDIPARENVTIVTNSRLIGERGGVLVNPAQRQVGPLTLP